MNNLLVDVIEKYLLSQNLFVNQNLLKKYFASVPSFPSIFALVQTLKQFGIVLSVVSSDWNTLFQCDEKVLLHLKGEKDLWVILESCSDEEIVYKDGNSTAIREKKELFLEKWDGLLLYIESIDEEVQSALLKTHRIEMFRKYFLYSSLLIIIGCLIFQGLFTNSSNILSIPYLSLKIVGGIASYFLLRHSFGLTSEFENKVCFISKLTDCNAVLHSSASKVFNKISMSDIGLVYFSGGILLLLLSLLSSYIGDIWSFLILLSFCSIPYCLFSISYQIFAIKKICPFCLVVVTTLLLESILGIYFLQEVEIGFNIAVWGICLFTFVLLAAVLSFVKEAYKKNQRFENLEFEYLKFKRNGIVYTSLLQHETELKKADVESIVVGDSNASTVITVFLGLYCNLCTDTFKRIKRLLLSSSSDFLFHIHFVSNEVGNQVFIHLYSIYKEEGADAFIEALEKWYASHDFEKVKQLYPLKELLSKDCLSMYKIQHSHLEEINKIDRTPTCYVNGRLLPGLYKINDLVYFS